jgi:hypothetical protein
MMRTPLAVAVAAVALVAVPTARGGGDYVLDGGTAAERHGVVAALEASSFDWSLVPGQTTIHIVRGADSFSIPGEIWLDADLLDAGHFAWGVVQHEYAHQVDYTLLDDELRARFLKLLGAHEWCYESVEALAHGDYGCERFASTLAWSYWQSPENCMRPTSPTDESAGVSPRRFRAALDSALRRGTVRTVARVSG